LVFKVPRLQWLALCRFSFAVRDPRRNLHNGYLFRQAIDKFIALRTCAAGSIYVLPSRYDADLPISNATLNQVTTSVSRVARAAGRLLADYTPHDLRRTASTLLHEAGYNTDRIEKYLATESQDTVPTRLF
jgi:integrase